MATRRRRNPRKLTGGTATRVASKKKTNHKIGQKQKTARSRKLLLKMQMDKKKS